jgi:hypothetical protein
MKNHDDSSIRKALYAFIPERRELEPDWEGVLGREQLIRRKSPRREKKHKPSRRVLIVAFVALLTLAGAAIALSEKLELHSWAGSKPIYGPQEVGGCNSAYRPSGPAGDVAVIAHGSWSHHDWVMVAYLDMTDGSACTAIQFRKSLDLQALLTPKPGWSPILCTTVTVLNPKLASPAQASGAQIVTQDMVIPGANSKAKPQLAYVIGAVVDEIKTVRIEFNNGRTIEVKTLAVPASLGLPMRFFSSQLPSGAVITGIEGLGKNGSLLR